MAYVISNDCVACGTCIDECPVEAISEGSIYSINPDLVQLFVQQNVSAFLNWEIFKVR